MDTKVPILLVEDDLVDVMTVRRCFEELNIENPLVNAVNGEEALEYLQDTENPRPSLVLLDLNMPRMNGFEFLRAVKSDDFLKAIPVVILTTSNQSSDVLESYQLGAAGYIVKSADYCQFVEAIGVLYNYWSSCCLPNFQLCTNRA
jgi:CheY-like chemotaxis protein